MLRFAQHDPTMGGRFFLTFVAKEEPGVGFSPVLSEPCGLRSKGAEYRRGPNEEAG